MAKITWTPRADSGVDSAISASIFNEISSSVNDLYDAVEAQLGTTGSLGGIFGYTGSAGDAGTLTVSASIVPLIDAGAVTSSTFDLGAPDAAWRDIYVSTGSLIFVGAGGITSSFSKADLDFLKEGKSISTASGKQVVNTIDPDTFIKNDVTDKMTFVSNNFELMDIDGGSKKVNVGRTNGSVGIAGIKVAITGSTVTTGSFENTGSLSISGSLNNTGSFVSTGSFSVNNLLNLLANYGQTGIPTGSGEGGIETGDINLDGQVNVNDLLLVLGGFGNPNIIVTDTTVPPNVNHQFVGPTLTVSQSVTLSISTGSYVTLTL